MGGRSASRARELTAAREFLRPDRATTEHDRVLDVVAERVLLDMFSPAGHTPAPGSGPRIVVSARVSGRVAAPSAC